MKCPFATFVGADSHNFSPVPISHRFVVIHVAEGNNQGGIDAWFHNPSAIVSAHFSISKLGVIHQHVDTDHMAYHCAAWNDKAIGIEHLGYSGQKLTFLQTRSLKRLLKWIHANHGTKLQYVNNPNNPQGGVIGHGKIPEGSLSHPNCPGWPILQQVERLVRGLEAPVLPPSEPPVSQYPIQVLKRPETP